MLHFIASLFFATCLAVVNGAKKDCTAIGDILETRPFLATLLEFTELTGPAVESGKTIFAPKEVNLAGLLESLGLDTESDLGPQIAALDDGGEGLKAAATDILLYHVSGDKIMAADVADGVEISTLQGESLTVKVNEESGLITLQTVSAFPLVNDLTQSKIIATDIVTCEGPIIHTINKVMLPTA